MPVDTQATDTAAAPATSAPDTQSAPAQTSADTAAGTGASAQPSESAPVQETASQTPQGALAAAAEGQMTQQQAQLLAGKFKGVPDLEAGYKNAERQLTRLAQEKKTLEERLSQAQPKQQQPDQQTDPWMDQWAKDPMFGPLSNMPDPRYDPKGHEAWFGEVFAPRFQHDPKGTMQHMIMPMVRNAQIEVYNKIREEFQSRDTESQLTQFFTSKPEFLDKPVAKAFEEWGEEGLAQYQDLLSKGVPVEAAVELIARRQGMKPLTAQVAAAQAKDRDIASLASGSPSRGATPSTEDGMIGEGESVQEKTFNALKKAGYNIEAPSMARKFGSEKKAK